MSPIVSPFGKHGPLVGAVDQGTSSTRFLVFAAKTAELLTYHQIELKQHFPEEGYDHRWAEEDPNEILSTTRDCIDQACAKLRKLDIDPMDIKAIGVCNQRETTVVWDKYTGKPLFNAILWLDLRTASVVSRMINKAPGRSKEYLRNKCGLPLSTYFSASKIVWLMENVPEVKRAIAENRCMIGTVDTWLIWNLTGGAENKDSVYVTDVTNASRTMLMNIETLKWDRDLCQFFDIPMEILPEIRSSSEIYGRLSSGELKGVPISGCLGDQQAAFVGNMCFKPGTAKNTYGTGCFMLYNIGTEPVISNHGLLTTVAFKFGDNKAYYALEGSIAVAGSGVRWLRDNLGIFENSDAMNTLPGTVESSSHGVYFVPAFSGLYAPYWVDDARGLIIGLTQYTTKAHIARAMLEAVCFQTKEIVECMDKDCGGVINKLRVDGGMTANDFLMQLQADILGIPISRPSMPETSALGAAMAAGAAKGIDVWPLEEHKQPIMTFDTFTPNISDAERDWRYGKWKTAVQRSMHWIDTDASCNCTLKCGGAVCMNSTNGTTLKSSQPGQ